LLHAGIGAAAFLVACSGSKPPGEPTVDPVCPVAADVRPFLERIVLDVVRNVAWVGGVSIANEHGFALTPFGFFGTAGRLTLAIRCTGPATFAPFCGVDSEPLSFCQRSRCERSGVTLKDVYLARRPQTDAADRHRVEYESLTYPGHVVYDPNPFVTYRIDETMQGSVGVTSDIQHDLVFTPRGSPSIDLSHAGGVSYVKAGAEIRQFVVNLSFAGLSPRRPVTVQLELNPDGIASGAVTASGRRLATIVGVNHSLTTGPTYTWEGDCGP